MIQKDLNRLNMWKTVYAVLQMNKDVWKGIKAFSEAVDKLKEYIDAADAAAGKQASGKTGGITADKNGLATAAIDATLKLAKIARAYARKAGNNTLFKTVDYERSELEGALDELEAHLTGIIKAATAEGMKEQLKDYGYKDGMDTAATAAIAAYHAASPNTRVAIAGRTTVTKSVPEIMKGGKAQLLTMDDLIHLFDDDAPEFEATYRAAREIVDAGTGGKDKPKEFPGS